MEITVERMERASVVHASGEIDAVTCGKLEEALKGLIDGGENRIVLDLQGVLYISSAGLRVLLMATQRLYDTGRFVISRVTDDVREVLQMSGFTNIIEIHDDLKGALTAVASN